VHLVVTVQVDASLAVGNRAVLRTLLPPRQPVYAGAAVRVALNAADAHVFDALTGRALWHPEGGAVAGV
jgi:multiple sugar transport system ATP-binding protein